MRNHLFISLHLFILSSAIGIKMNAQSIQSAHADKRLTIEDAMHYQVYDAVLKMYQYQEPTLSDKIENNKAILLATLNERPLETTASIRSHDKAQFNNQEISSALVSMIKDYSQAGIIQGGDIAAYGKSLGIEEGQLSQLNFYIGYEAFKKKDFATAITAFETTIDQKHPEYNYAQYYSGIAQMLSGKYDVALSHFLKIGKDEILHQHLPYYLATSHYALGHYPEVIQYYSTRTNERIQNSQSIKKIVALSYYHQQDYDNAIALLDTDDPTDEIFPAIAYALNQSGKHQQLLNLLTTDVLSDRLKYEKAYALALTERSAEAIKVFESLKNTSVNQNLINYNLAQLHSASGNSQNAIAVSQQLLNTEYHDAGIRIINNHLNAIEDPRQLAVLSKALRDNPQSQQVILKKIYNKGLKAVNNKNWDAVTAAINEIQLLSIPTEYDELLSAHLAIYQLKNGQTAQAKSKLSELIANNSLSSDTGLLGACQYYLGYLHFQEENVDRALGLFSNAKMNLQQSTLPQHEQLSDDIYNRMGDCYVIQNDLENAERAYSYSFQNNRGVDHALYQKALVAELRGKLYDQVILLQELYDDYPHSEYAVSAKYKAAKSLFNLGKYQKAEELYRDLANHTVDRDIQEKSIIQLGLINVNAGDFAQAEQYYQRILHTSTNDENRMSAQNALKEIYRDYNTDTEAYVAITKEIETDKSPEQILYELSRTHLDNGENDKALSVLDELIQDHPNGNYKNQAVKSKIDILYKLAAWDEYLLSVNKHIDLNEAPDIATKVGVILYEKNKDYQSYIAYANQGYFDHEASTVYRKAIAQIETDQHELIQKDLSTLCNAMIDDTQKSEIIQKLTTHQISTRQWDQILDNRSNIEISRYIQLTPKEIYAHSLALMNLNKLEESIDKITSNYDLLITDSAWLAKSIILLSDAYYLKGDKNDAIAALEGLLSAEIEIPQSLILQAEKRLNSLNL